MNVLGDVLQTARRARGMTQADLASATGITQAALSRYENDMRSPGDDALQALGAALGVTPEFLRRAGRIHGGIAIDAHMRRRMTARSTVWRKLESQLNMYRVHASMLFEEVAIRAQYSVPKLDPEEIRPADAARITRMQWRMPSGPVRHFISWLESAGILVIHRDFSTTRVDGLSQWNGDHPVILINGKAPTDRQRLTLAHELGHIVLHSEELSAQLEQEANEFAAEFLMPFEVIKPQLRKVTIGRLHDLKREWGVSMQALIERAFNTGLMSRAARTNLYKGLSYRGWRTQEPISDELPPEVPTLTMEIADALMQRGLTADDIARIAGFDTVEENDLFVPERPRLRAV